jgi:hypothetical protein
MEDMEDEEYMVWKNAFVLGKKGLVVDLTYRRISETQWEFRSRSSGGTYITTLGSPNERNRERRDNLHCTCMGWCKHNTRWCVHCSAVMKLIEVSSAAQVLDRRKNIGLPLKR